MSAHGMDASEELPDRIDATGAAEVVDFKFDAVVASPADLVDVDTNPRVLIVGVSSGMQPGCWNAACS